ncbi:Uncharacterised protein [Bordetella pertussis]|nr:Uncharacterised protein [Bordetella pertussis]
MPARTTSAMARLITSTFSLARVEVACANCSSVNEL